MIRVRGHVSDFDYHESASRVSESWYHALAKIFVPLPRSVHDLVSAFVEGTVQHAQSDWIEKEPMDEEVLKGKVNLNPKPNTLNVEFQTVVNRDRGELE